MGSEMCIRDRLETVQKQAMKIIFGWDIDYDKLVQDGTIETLSKRRDDNVIKFALKATQSPRFGPAWFKETPITDREVRESTRLKYVEKFSRTERGRNNPIDYMTRMLNEHLSKNVNNNVPNN